MQVLLTARAEKNFDSIVNYIHHKWGKATAHQFVQKIDDILTLLEKHPAIGQIENRDIRGFQGNTTNQNTLSCKGKENCGACFLRCSARPKEKMRNN